MMYRNALIRFGLSYVSLSNFIQVVGELSSLGLNASTLRLLVSGSDEYAQPNHEADKPVYLQYEFEGISLLQSILIKTRRHH